MSTYNGHKNWAHWNVSLWINNDEGLYNLARDCVRRGRNRRHAAALMCATLDERGQFKTPDGARYSLSAVRGAMVGMGVAPGLQRLAHAGLCGARVAPN